jgi:CRP-like cAMP-binding protein
MLLNDAALKALFERKGRTYAPGSVIFLENETGEEMYIVVTGEVEIQKTYKEQEIFGGTILTIGNTPETLAILGPGDFFGEMALWNDAPRMATARARTMVEVIILRKEDLDALIVRSPMIAVQMLRSVCQRLRDMSDSPRIEPLLPRLRGFWKEIQEERRRLKLGAGKSGEMERTAEPTPARNVIEFAAAGASGGRTCPTCKNRVHPDDRFCAKCGEKLPAA